MKVLVTGGTGFAGAALVERLIGDGHQVVALDCREGLRSERLRSIGADVRIGSVVDRPTVESCMDGVELVHHLAAAFRNLKVPERHYYEVNVIGTRTVIECAAAAGVRKFVHCSTCGVHGNIQNPPADEDAPIAPADYYQRTKHEAEPIVSEFRGKSMETVILRPTAIYGPGDPERFGMIFRRVARGSFPMFGSGKTLYHPLYIDNLVDAFIACMQPGVGDGGTFLIADEHYYSIEEIVRKVGEALGIKPKIRHYPVFPLVVLGHVVEKACKPFGIIPPIFPRRVDWYRQNRAFDIARAKRDLGYRPAVGLDEGLRKTGEWYRATGLL